MSCSKKINIFFNQLPQQVEETIECPLTYRKVSKPQLFRMRRMEYLLSTLWHDWMLYQLSGSRRQGTEVSQTEKIQKSFGVCVSRYGPITPSSGKLVSLLCCLGLTRLRLRILCPDQHGTWSSNSFQCGHPSKTLLLLPIFWRGLKQKCSKLRAQPNLEHRFLKP